MTMDKSESIAAMEVERCSKLGTLRLQQGFPNKAMEAYKSAYKNAQSLSSHGYMLRACAFNLGAMSISTGYYVEGLAYLNKAIPPEGKRDGRSNGDLYFNYGLAYEGLKNVDKARHYYETALKEYRAEHNNVKMEAETISRISRLCLENNLMSEANDWMKQLILLHSNLGDVEKELQSRVERSNLLLKMGRAQEAEEVADACLEVLENATPSLIFAKMYSDLSVAYTQILHYDKAIACSEKALPLVEGLNWDPRLASVIYQNLGAVYNYKGFFDEAIKYHEKACDTFAKLQMRASQGHCFTNMGYAYSQIDDMDKAGDYFMHGLQAARDCGDHKTEWQNLEALGTIAYKKKSLKKAEKYYQQAISVLAQAPDQDLSVHERLITKLKNAIQAQVPRSATAPKPAMAPKENLSHLVRRASNQQENVKYKDLKSLASQMESGNIKVIRKGNQVRYLKVRRSGTLRRFKKVALGLDVPGVGDMDQKDEDGDGEKEEEEDESENTFESSDISEEDSNDDVEDETDMKIKTSEKEDETKNSDISEEDSNDDVEDETDMKIKTSEKEDETKKHQGARPPDSYLPQRRLIMSDSNSENNGSVEQLEAGEDSDDSDDEALMKKLMQQHLSEDEENTLRKQVVTADVHDEQGSESEISDSDSDEQETKKRLKPPVPPFLPQTTAEKSLRTYETPLENSGMTYQNIDHQPPTGTRTEDGGFSFSTGCFSSQPTDSDGINFFHEDDLYRACEKPSNKKEDETIYETLQPQGSKSRKRAKSGSDADNENSDGEMQRLSRAERDVVMYKEFQTSNREKQKDSDSETGDQKSSKHCIVM